MSGSLDATTDVTPQREPAPTPLVSSAHQSRRSFTVYDTPRERFDALDSHARCRVDNGAHGTDENHLTGLLGEDAVARHLGIADRLDTNLYANGDGGVDLVYEGATIDVKTKGQHRQKPILTVDAYEPLRAEYYALAHRIGPNRCRLIGYTPRIFVANAPIRRSDDGPYHHVPQEYLFPFPSVVSR